VNGPAAKLARAAGIDPRGCIALARALVTMDLRAGHYAAATATRPGSLVSPLFLVVGQCLTASALATLLLFARVDVFFFTFVNLSIGLLVLAAALVVEFGQVVLDPRDLEVIGHRPVTPRTYAAARLANLLFYFLLLYLGLNLFPLLVGAGLRDAGPWYAPAYLAASLAGSLAVTAAVIVVLSAGGLAGRLEALKAVLAWAQILLILVVFYGGQLVLRDGTNALLVWGAFPPGWIDYLPVTWLARFVERAAVAPGPDLLLPALAVAGVALAGVALTVVRVARLYRRMHPSTPPAFVRPMPPDRVGGLGGRWTVWLLRGPEERAGFWMCRAMLGRDPDLVMRSLVSFALPVVAVLFGLGTRQFGNPCAERDPARITLPTLAVYLIALAVPAVLYNLTFCRDGGGPWLWSAAPLGRPAGLARGAARAVLLLVVTPCCLLLGCVAAWVWGDPLAAAAHALLAWLLAWLAGLAALWLLVPDLPFSRSPLRGGSLGLPPLPMLAVGAVAAFVGGLHLLFAGRPEFWIAAAVAGPAGGLWLGRQAQRRLNRLARPS
jgi:hypothetical protein